MVIVCMNTRASIEDCNLCSHRMEDLEQTRNDMSKGYKMFVVYNWSENMLEGLKGVEN